MSNENTGRLVDKEIACLYIIECTNVDKQMHIFVNRIQEVEEG